MDAEDILKAVLDNPTLMEEYRYGKGDIADITFEPPHEHEFLRFMQSAVKVMEENQDETVRTMAGRLIKFFEETYRYENS